ncbi:MAG: TetR/AcrR family transcriptional regulator [Desulfovermiculus sp.]|nr:TetR/AcrR family transcriptional regulator [Desulfovermiculus sp.]
MPAQKQGAILEAAIAEFAAYGYHQASINRLVNRLGIAKGSIFQYFGSKQGLFEHVFAQTKEIVSEHLRFIREHTRDKDFFTRLSTILISGLAFVREHPGLYRMYMHVLRDEHLPGRAAYLQQVRTASRAYLAGLVDQGLANQELAPDLSREWTVLFLDALLDRFFQVLSDPGQDGNSQDIPPGTDQEHVQSLIHFIRKGLGQRKS